MAFLRTFLIYGLGAAVSRLAAVFLVPIYTRTLSVEVYGQLEVLLSLQLAGVLLAGLQSESALLRDYYYAKERGELPRLIWGAVLISLAGSVALAFGVSMFWTFGLLAPYVAQNIMLLFWLIVLAQLLGLQLIILRFAGAIYSFSIASFLDLGLSAVFSVVFIVFLHMGIPGALLGMICGKTICVLWVWSRTFGSPRKTWSTVPMIRSMLAYSLPTLPSVLLNWLQTNGTRVLLAIFLTLSDVGIVGVSIRVAALYGFVVYAFRLTWEPYAFSHIDKAHSDPKLYDRIMQSYMLTMLPLAGVAILAAPLLTSIFAPPQYSAAVGLTGFFIMGQFWLGATNITSIGIHGAKITSRLTIVYGVGAAINMASLALMSSTLGVRAAAIGFLASQVAGTLVAAYYSQRHFNIRFSARSLAFGVVGSAVMAAGSLVIYRPFTDTATNWSSVHMPYLELGCLVITMAVIILRWGIGLEMRQKAFAEMEVFRAEVGSFLKRRMG